MPLAGRAGRGRRLRWPLLAAWVVSVAILLAMALLPRPAARVYGAVLLGGSVGSLIVILAYARLLRRGTPPQRTLLLVGGPCPGRLVLTGTGAMPEFISLASPGAPVCSYRYQARGRDGPQIRVLRYEPDSGIGPAASP